jgi:hypothetical protein
VTFEERDALLLALTVRAIAERWAAGDEDLALLLAAHAWDLAADIEARS